METTRRNFIGMAGAAGIAAAGAALGGTQAFAKVPEVWDEEHDVVILGSGSGAAGAIVDCLNAGVDTLVVEKMDWMGGTLRRSGGGIAAAGTCVQKALGVEDDVEEFYNYIVDCGEGVVDPELLRVFVDRAAADFDWIVQDLAGQTEEDWFFVDGDQGLTIAMAPGLNVGGTPIFFEDYGYKPIPRCYWFSENPEDIDEDGDRYYDADGTLGRPETDKGRGGTGLWKAFQDAIDEIGGLNVKLQTSIRRLVANEDGEVAGVIVEDLTTGEETAIKANKGVILATGTWVFDEELCDTFLLGADQSIFQWYSLPHMASGEGVKAALALGAKTISMAAGWWQGGLKTDTNAQVLDVFGNPIPRLYASSYAVGGKLGTNYPHCGLHNLWNISLGRVAAENVLDLEPWE